jgi:AcrR family transcriptional regulator
MRLDTVVSIRTSAHACKVPAMATSRATNRARNRRGEGGRLREEIVDAARELLEEHGNEASISLRAVARRVGITAPSIYPHFARREDILRAVITRAADELVARLEHALRGEKDPVARLRAGCDAYVTFAAEHPHHYRVLFERRRPPGAATLERSASVNEMAGAEAFAILLNAIEDCIAAGASKAPSPLAAATQLWAALHGYVTLRASVTDFPWPDDDELLDALITRLTWIEAVPRRA